MGHILKSTLNKMLGRMDSYVKSWKIGAYGLFIMTITLAMAFFIGSAATEVILGWFNVELTDTWKALGLIAVLPFYVGVVLCRMGS